MDRSIIPGASILGFGFNILGEYSSKSVTTQILQPATGQPTTWTYQPSGVEYDVPKNVTVNAETSTGGNSYVFEDQHEFSSHFAASAEVEASAGAFSGEWSMAYSKSLQTSQSSYYCLYEALFNGWSVQLQNEDASAVNAQFLQAAAGLADTFDPGAPQAFFRFFAKWGTHFISYAAVGGAFRYYIAVDESYNQTKEQISTDVSLEYKAVFVDAEASAHMDWETLTTNWAKSRTVTVSAKGGDTSPLNTLSPAFDDSKADTFNTWRAAVMSNPAITTFKLRPIWMVAPKEKQVALSTALAAYTGDVLSVFAVYQFGGKNGGAEVVSPSVAVGVAIAGRSVLPAPLPAPPAPVEMPQNPGGTASPYSLLAPSRAIALTILDRESLRVLFSQVYYFSAYWDPLDPDKPERADPNLAAKAAFAQLWLDVQPAISGQQDYVVALACVGHWITGFPPPDVANWLASCGAGLDGWWKTQPYEDYRVCNYLFIGHSGGERLAENMTAQEIPTADPDHDPAGYTPMRGTVTAAIYASDA